MYMLTFSHFQDGGLEYRKAKVMSTAEVKADASEGSPVSIRLMLSEGEGSLAIRPVRYPVPTAAFPC